MRDLRPIRSRAPAASILPSSSPRRAIALVIDMRLQQRERKTALVADVFQRAGDRNDMRKMRDIGQESADLRLGIDAGAQAAIDLQKPMIAQHDDGVGAARAERAHL